MNVTLDGVTKTVTFSDKTYTSAQDAAEELQTLLDGAFGGGRIDVSGEDGTLSLISAASKITLGAGEDEETSALFLLGFARGPRTAEPERYTVRSRPRAGAEPGDIAFTINGEQFSFSSSVTLNTILNTVNASKAGVTLSYSSLSDTFTMVSKDTGSASAVSFGDTEGSFLGAILGEGVFTAGAAAVIKVGLNGETDEGSLITVTRSKNSFEINGIVLTLNKKADGDAAEGVTVAAEPDADSFVEKIRNFVSDYNSLLDSINGKLSEERYRDFLPLTDEQKESLSESDQALWTEKAKSGLLQNDIYLTAIVRDLRSSLYAAVQTPGSTGDTLGIILPTSASPPGSIPKTANSRSTKTNCASLLPKTPTRSCPF
jgi:flagellar hook-associated protein 2